MSSTKTIGLCFLGSGDAFGSGGRLQVCLYLYGDGQGVLVDCGASSLIALKRRGINPSEISAILLTHLHGDHFGGVPFLVLDGQFSGRTNPLIVAGPPGVAARVESAMEVFFPGSTKITRRFPLQFIELADRQCATVGPCRVTPYEVCHPSGAPSYALHAEYGGKIISYSGDTEWVDELVEVARGADVFVCEAYTFDKRVKYHLDYRTIRDRRKELKCKRLILIHMSRNMLDHLQECEFEVAEDEKTIVV